MPDTGSHGLSACVFLFRYIRDCVSGSDFSTISGLVSSITSSVLTAFVFLFLCFLVRNPRACLWFCHPWTLPYWFQVFPPSVHLFRVSQFLLHRIQVFQPLSGRGRCIDFKLNSVITKRSFIVLDCNPFCPLSLPSDIKIVVEQLMVSLTIVNI